MPAVERRSLTARLRAIVARDHEWRPSWRGWCARWSPPRELHRGRHPRGTRASSCASAGSPDALRGRRFGDRGRRQRQRRRFGRARRAPALRCAPRAQRRNQGFARACNQGLALEASPYALLLNADTRRAEGHRAAGDFRTEYGVRGRTQARERRRTTQRSCMCFPRLRGAGVREPNAGSPDSASCDATSAAISTTSTTPTSSSRRPRACSCGELRWNERGLDESLPLYFNDVDLAALGAARLKTRFVAAARCVHHVGQSTRQPPTGCWPGTPTA